jgi:hypothetical protein
MIGVKAFQRKRKRVRLVKGKGVARLRLDVHAHHLKAGTRIAHSRTATATAYI